MLRWVSGGQFLTYNLKYHHNNTILLYETYVKCSLLIYTLVTKNSNSRRNDGEEQ